MRSLSTRCRPLAGGVCASLLLVAAHLSAPSPAAGQDFALERREMVEALRTGRPGAPPVEDTAVLRAMEEVPRHRFVPPEVREAAYEMRPLPIGRRQTISSPYIVAKMTELAGPGPGDVAFELGTGSGYQAAVLGELVDRVYTVEIIEEVAGGARGTLSALGYSNVSVRHGDGFRGWPEHAPYDVVLVTAAAEEVPPRLVEQLAPGGRLVVPVGPAGGVQTLTVIEKREDGGVEKREVMAVRFVPVTHDVR